MDIKQKIRELVSDAGETFGLAVVLRAIGKEGWNPDITINKDGRLHIFTLNKGTLYWNLSADNYDQQSEECKQFIREFLGV